MKKVITVVFSITFLVLGLTACGGDEGDDAVDAMENFIDIVENDLIPANKSSKTSLPNCAQSQASTPLHETMSIPISNRTTTNFTFFIAYSPLLSNSI